MKVKAAAGLRVPYENQPRRYIEQKPVDVPDTIYYRRLLAAGDLVNVSDLVAVKGKAKRKEAADD
ncbi:DUF2635 domain-containing protein [Salmonella enterica]|uniref:DUF2635 domain-containing protein n=1 Tax=Salmonella enterica TaxID=28901 RepID=A0A756I6N6_SALER|nr:DUF2635 domain-containing protein [Salmonella enterica]ECH1122987.1 DUF2635 domain-containing protein [Salmonella enterica subsp. diarizonae]ECM1814045.1 DUF2635 domain-containing protein [Salmonella enterica subsp. enterica serovar Newport]EEP9439729.1 DUF2635 domain-containing protein [Salmonella enterica subsp. enterica serovar Reading]EHQ1784513.1 DUF2635 domain-containing protein [Salmonella enterica subsp. enterica serovar Oranienburg]HAD5967747.1 DUF2635 domain-containing protein [Sa